MISQSLASAYTTGRWGKCGNTANSHHHDAVGSSLHTMRGNFSLELIEHTHEPRRVNGIVYCTSREGIIRSTIGSIIPPHGGEAHDNPTLTQSTLGGEASSQSQAKRDCFNRRPSVKQVKCAVRFSFSESAKRQFGHTGTRE